MRIFVITLIALVAVIAALLATGPRLVDWNDYRELLTRQAEAVTGSTVAIEGHIGFGMLPSPTLTLARVRLSGGTEGDTTELVADRIDLRLRVLPLLRGDVEVGDIRIVRPVLHWNRTADWDGLLSPDGSNPVLSLIGLRADHLALVDGRAVVRDADGASWQIRAIDLEMSGESREGPFAVSGGFRVGGRQLQVDATIGSLSRDQVAALELDMSVLGAEPARLTYDGAVWWEPSNPRARGDLVLAGEQASSTIAMIAAAFGQNVAALPASLGPTFEVAGALQIDRERLQLGGLAVTLGETSAEGRLDLTFGAEPVIGLALGIDDLELHDAAPARLADLAPLATLVGNLRGEIDLSIATLRTHGHVVQRVRTSLRPSGDGSIAIEQAGAVLPGQTLLRFQGRLLPAGQSLTLEGDVSAATDDLRALLGALDLVPAAVASRRLRTLSLSAAVSVGAQTTRIADAELRVDASQLRGNATMTAAPADGAAPRLSADLTLDRLNVEAYQAAWNPAEAAALAQRLLRGLDAEITARAQRLTWHGLLMSNVAVALQAEQGRVRVTEAVAEVSDEAMGRLSGDIDLESGAFAWSGEIRTTQVARFLRRLGLTVPLTWTRAPPLGMTFSAAGTGERFAVESQIDDGTGRLRAVGEAGWREDGWRYDLEVVLRHPDFGALVRPLGARTAVGDDATPAELDFTGKIAGTAFQNTIAGSARLGPMSLTGLLAWRHEEQRPRYDLQLSAAEPTAEMLTALLELAGLSPPAGLLDGPLLGNWPRHGLPLEGLSLFDGSLKLTAKGGLAGEGTEVDARLQDARLFVDRIAARHRHGTVTGELILDTDRPLPFLTAELDLQDIDAAWLAAKLDLDPVIEGGLDLTAQATAAGSSLYDLVRGLIGAIEITMAEGRISGFDLQPIAESLGQDPAGTVHDRPALPFTGLNGELRLERGLASTDGLMLDIEQADARVAGVIDLLLWATDLTVEVDASRDAGAPVVLKIVGPLRRPQTHVDLPPEVQPASP